MARTTLYTDSFNRANENPLAAPWSEIPGSHIVGSWQLLSNNACPTANNLLTGMYFNDGVITWPDNQWCEVVCNGLPTSRGGGPAVRCSASQGTFYGVQANNTDLILFKVVNDTFTALASDPNPVADGTTIRIEAEGTDLRVYLNDVLTLSASDAAIASGFPGGRMYLPTSVAVGTGQFDQWSAGGFDGGVVVPVRANGLQGGLFEIKGGLQ